MIMSIKRVSSKKLSFQSFIVRFMDSLPLRISPTALEKNSITVDDSKEKVILLILRDLIRLNWSVSFESERIVVSPPDTYDKSVIKQSMAVRREEVIKDNIQWIDNHIDLARTNLVDGTDAINSKIRPIIEVCRTQKQHDLFRILRYYWSSPYSEYVGRRIKLIVRDSALPGCPVIGIAALGSPIIHIPERDDWIGWDKDTRTQNLNFAMDAYVVGAMPPYNYLLGGKLVSYVLASSEVRKIFENKYASTTYNRLAGMFTTSLYGRSSQYNRLRTKDRLLYQPIGSTRGFGTLHLTNETFVAMNDYLRSQNVIVGNRFGDGPSWTMRVIRSAGRILGFDADFLLRHSFKRSIYFISLAHGSKEFLRGETTALRNYSSTLNTLSNYWKRRWLKNRLLRAEVIEKVKTFQKEDFDVR